MPPKIAICLVAGLSALLTGCRPASRVSTGTVTAVTEPRFPVRAEVFIDQFRAAEGITFNGRGQLFIGANRGIWIARPDGEVTRIADVSTHLGQAGIGERDILAADFGPRVFPTHGANDDGVVWRITPEGRKTAVATGFGDPNFVTVLRDRSFLVSDDFTDRIYHVERDGRVSVWSAKIPYPNGMVLSPDDRRLYVAQIFSSLGPPIELTDVIWALPIDGRLPAGEPRIAARTGGKGVDGLAMDRLGRVYVADNHAGKIWRLAPQTGELVLVAEGVPHAASLVFGEGKFDRRSLYVACTERGGGRIWRVPVGIEGAPLYR